MEEIHILPTNQTPEFIFRPDGFIKIRGRGLFSDRPEGSERIINWIEAYLKNPAKVTHVTIAFEYLNSLSTIFLVSILKDLSQVSIQSKYLFIKWYYEDDDEDILERGKYISSYVEVPIEFIITDNIAGH